MAVEYPPYPPGGADSLVELQQSLYNYGLPDMSAFSLNSPKDQSRLSWMLESTVTTSNRGWRQ